MITFHCHCRKKLQVAETMAGKKVRCPDCQSVLVVPEEEIPLAQAAPEPDGSYQESAGLKALYLTSLIVGVAIAAYVYVIDFNRWSETQLVNFTPAWFFPIVFGFYGFVSQKLIGYIEAGKASTLTDAAKILSNAAGYWSLLVMFPFLALKWRSSVLVTLVGSLFWALLLWVFFAAIFQKL